MTIENIIKELKEKGFEAEKKSVNKNGVELLAITIKNETNAAPVIYYHNELNTDQVIELYEKHKTNSIDINSMLTSEYILNNCFVGLAKSLDENVLKRNSVLNDLFEYIYVKVNINLENGTIKLTNDIAKDIDNNDLWEKAIENTCKNTDFVSMSEKLFGVKNENDPFYILTSKDGTKGAGAIVNTEVLKEYANKHNTNKLLILPSSIHELLVVPYTNDMNKAQYDVMVEDVNKTQVLPEEQLANESFVLEF